MRKLNLVLAVALLVMCIWIAKAWSKDKPLGEYEPALRESRQIEREIVEREAKAAGQQRQLLAALETAVDKFDPKQFGSMDAVMQNMRPAVRQLHDISTQLVSQQDAYATDMQSLREAVMRAPDVYRKASTMFKDYADKESFVEIKADYAGLSESWRQMAEDMQHHGEAVQADEKELGEFREYLKHTNLFLERLDQHLASLPQMPSETERAMHATQMQRYVEGFEALRKSLRTFHDKLLPATAAPGEVSKPAPLPNQNEKPVDSHVAKIAAMPGASVSSQAVVKH